jgi:signal transduction histidine kinase
MQRASAIRRSASERVVDRTNGSDPSGAARHGHTVQFYDDDAFLAGSVAQFVTRGLAAHRPVLLVATREHVDAITERLTADGHDLDRARRTGRITVLDAHATLALVMSGDTPDRERFQAVIGGGLERCLGRGRGPVWAYGELVNLLVADGNAEGALRLEALWNELAATHSFVLLCGYALAHFRDVALAEPLRAICATHTHVIPAESYTSADDADRMVEVSVLQHRARVLESELARRTELEQRLQVALSERDVLLDRERTARHDAESAREAAEAANHAKGEFLAIMSHELRTPLNAIAGYAELLELGVHGPVTCDQRDALGRIQRSQRHLLGLINEVLNYTRIESGIVRYELTTLCVDDVLRTADALVMPQMQAKGLEYRYVGADRALHVRADPDRLQQIVLNLLTNAAKFTDRGGVVSVSCEAQDDAIAICVTDNGVGIPAEKFDAIFEPFVQIDSRLTRVQEGIGLGLAISRDLARGMGGDLRVTSKPGVGSTFVLSLPRG